MNFLKRGLQSLWAKKGRSLILIAVFSAILIFVLAGLTIKSAADTATSNAKKSVGATVTLSTNREQMFKKADTSDATTETDTASDTETDSRPDPTSFQMTPVNLEDAQAIAELDGVKSYSFEVSTSATKGEDIEPISSSDSDSEADTSTDSESQGMGGRAGGDMMNSDGGMAQGDFQITGVLESSAYSSFSDGTATITDGEAITAADVDTNNVLIEAALAEANNLAVGDTFTLVDANEANVEVTVKGIYETSDTGTSMGMQFNVMNPANTIFSAYTLANTISGETEATIDSAVYTLEDPDEMTDFVAAAEKLIDTETFSLQTNDQMYQQMLTPLNNVSSFAKNIIILVAAAGVIILTLIIMMTIRERRFEIGVLLSLGEARSKVVLQFFTEIFVCMLLALGVASASGNLVGNVVGNQLLEQQTTQTAAAEEASPDAQGQGGPGAGGGRSQGGPGQMLANSFSQSEAVQDLNITVSPAEIAILAAIGLGISFFSILLSSAGIMRLNPKKILIS